MVRRLFTSLLASARYLHLSSIVKYPFRSNFHSSRSLRNSSLSFRWHHRCKIDNVRLSRANYRCFQRRHFGVYRAFARTNFTLWWVTSPEFRRFTYTLGGVTLCFLGYSTERVPVTGRWRFNCIPDFLLERKAKVWYQQLLEEFEGAVLPQSAPEVQHLQRVLERLLSSSRVVCRDLDDRPWTLQVVQSDKINAIVYPGRHLFVFSGILPHIKDEENQDSNDKAAALLGHEIAHHIAHHSAESLSSYAALLMVTWLATFVFNVPSHSTYETLDVAYLQRNSRAQETEADQLGLFIMAAAGYNPRATVDLMESLQRARKTEIAEYFSSHPSWASRAKQIQSWMDEALEMRKESHSKRRASPGEILGLNCKF